MSEQDLDERETQTRAKLLEGEHPTMEARAAPRAAILLAILSCGACAVDRAAADAGDTSSSTTGSGACARVHEGNLYVLEDTDLESLSDLGHVTGYIRIGLGTREQTDLSFLGCLETVGLGLNIGSSFALETTEGLARLTQLPNLVVDGNPKLRTIAGFDRIEEIGTLDIWSNGALEEVHLESLESIARLNVGYCSGPGTALSGNATLADIAGFASLAHVGDLRIRGNEALGSTQVLDVLATNQASPLEDVEIMWNANLPEQEVNAKLDALGVTGVRTVCGNAGGVQDQCDCGIE